MLVARPDQLLDGDVAAVLSERLKSEPYDPALVIHAALLAFARMDRAALAFGALSAPEEVPRRLAELARAGDTGALDILTLLSLQLEQPERVRAAVWFHRAIVLAVDAEPEDALSALQEARNLDPSQAAVWLGLLAELSTAQPRVLRLSQALARPAVDQ